MLAVVRADCEEALPTEMRRASAVNAAAARARGLGVRGLEITVLRTTWQLLSSDWSIRSASDLIERPLDAGDLIAEVRELRAEKGQLIRRFRPHDRMGSRVRIAPRVVE